MCAHSGDQFQSLFIISLPRSLSGFVYHLARGALSLKEPKWTTDGEILNADRFVFIPGPPNDYSRKFISASDVNLSGSIMEFLDEVVQPAGFAYKDVVQPFLITKWLQAGRFPTLRIRRNVADVALSMVRHSWYYPCRAIRDGEDAELQLVRGLLLAERALDSVRTVSVDFEQLICDAKPLESALSGLYGACVPELRYIDEPFQRRRAEVLEARNSDQYRRLSDFVARVTSSGLTLADVGP